jgi:hypothetical protein
MARASVSSTASLRTSEHIFRWALRTSAASSPASQHEKEKEEEEEEEKEEEGRTCDVAVFEEEGGFCVDAIEGEEETQLVENLCDACVALSLLLLHHHLVVEIHHKIPRVDSFFFVYNKIY